MFSVLCSLFLNMNILHVIQRYYPYQGGSEQVCQVLGERLAQEGHHVAVWTTDAWDLDHFWAKGRRRVNALVEQHGGVAIRRFPVTRAPGPPIIYPILRRLMVELGRFPGTQALLMHLAQITPRVPSFVQTLRTTPEQFDLVHTVNITLDFLIIPAWQYAKRHHIPHIITPYVHLGEPGNHALVRYYSMPHHIEIMKQSDRVIVQTPSEEDYLAACGVPRQIMRQIGVGIDPEQLQGGDATRFREQTGIRRPFILSIGALARDKGTFDVIKAMEHLWQQGRNEELVLIGTPLAHFEEYWERLPVATKARIHLLPRASEERKKDALAAAHLFAMPSRTDSFGIVYLEAWMYGLPVIGARAGGVPDVIKDGETGYLVPFGTPDALARSIERLLDNPELAYQLGQAGREHTLRHLTWERKYHQFRQVYAEVIQP